MLKIHIIIEKLFKIYYSYIFIYILNEISFCEKKNKFKWLYFFYILAKIILIYNKNIIYLFFFFS
jgi:hypothetical protein